MRDTFYLITDIREYYIKAHSCKEGDGGDCHFLPEQQKSGAWLLKGFQVCCEICTRR